MNEKALEQKKQQILRMLHSASDFQQALSSITFFMEEVDYTQETTPIVELRRLHCYETTAIVSFTRPLTETRGNNTLSTKFIGLKLSGTDRAQIKKFKDIRNSYMAHSAEDTMHFRVSMIDVKGSFKAPFTQFDEGLVLSEKDAFELARLSRLFLFHVMETKFKLAGESPELIEMYKQPTSPLLKEEAN